jgi:hypothetical protein
MNRFGLAFHHLGLAVREPSHARVLLEGLGYRIETPVFDAEQNVNIVMAIHQQMPDIEIIWSAGSLGPLDRMLEKHASGIVYHVCYVAEDLAASLASLAAAGLKAFCVSPPTGAVLFGGNRVSFYTVKGIGLIEIIEGTPGDPVAEPALLAALGESVRE